MESLPDFILLKILRNLDFQTLCFSLPVVSHSLWEISSDQSLYRYFEDNCSYSLGTVRNLLSRQTFQQNLQELDLRHCQNILSVFKGAIFPKLKSIKLSLMNDEVIGAKEVLVNAVPNLTDISIFSNCSLEVNKLLDSGLLDLPIVDQSYNIFIKDYDVDNFVKILDLCRNGQSITLFFGYTFYGEDFLEVMEGESLDVKCLVNMCGTCEDSLFHNLTQLACTIYENNDVVSFIVETLVNLKHLTLHIEGVPKKCSQKYVCRSLAYLEIRGGDFDRDAFPFDDVLNILENLLNNVHDMLYMYGMHFENFKFTNPVMRTLQVTNCKVPICTLESLMSNLNALNWKAEIVDVTMDESIPMHFVENMHLIELGGVLNIYHNHPCLSLSRLQSLSVWLWKEEEIDMLLKILHEDNSLKFLRLNWSGDDMKEEIIRAVMLKVEEIGHVTLSGHIKTSLMVSLVPSSCYWQPVYNGIEVIRKEASAATVDSAEEGDQGVGAVSSNSDASGDVTVNQVSEGQSITCLTTEDRTDAVFSELCFEIFS